MAAGSPKSNGAALFALGTIYHDGKRFEAGDKLPAMSAETEEALRAAGVVSAAPPEQDPQPTGSAA